ncbi:NADH-ubiquinone oxidoreductase subunit E family protein [Campylobacter helveticus]|uniref:NADH-ubiquinone oxidoreductase subunit E family protein n=1 Tax=Campylobacter helveticus TaxID=28898 RepID=UPI002149F9C0|nr:NADH-ubiquinone oxidoreductase subunit E family protein [Campylobacter helveticus]MCR2055984.1 NADH-ubiquinone oxidoreductase subunit E family protein [Campylobacter helveticus]
MRRVDLRKSKDLFEDLALLLQEAKQGEVLVVLFEIGDFSSVERSFAFVKEQNCELLNSLKFNEVDWSIVIKKVKI